MSPGESWGDSAKQTMEQAAQSVQETVDAAEKAWQDKTAEWTRAALSVVSDTAKTEHLQQDLLWDASSDTMREFARHASDTNDPQLLTDHLSRVGWKLEEDSFLESEVNVKAHDILQTLSFKGLQSRDPESKQRLDDTRAMFEKVNGLGEAARDNEELYYAEREKGYNKLHPPAYIAGLDQGTLENIYWSDFHDSHPDGWVKVFPNSEIPPADVVNEFAKNEAKLIREGGLDSTRTDLSGDRGLLRNPNLEPASLRNIALAVMNSGLDANNPTDRERLDGILGKIEYHPNLGPEARKDIAEFYDSFDQAVASAEQPGEEDKG